MKTIQRMSMCLLFIGATSMCFAQLNSDTAKKQTPSNTRQAQRTSPPAKSPAKRGMGISRQTVPSDANQAKPTASPAKSSSGSPASKQAASTRPNANNIKDNGNKKAPSGSGTIAVSDQDKPNTDIKRVNK